MRGEMMNSSVRPMGVVTMTIQHEDGTCEVFEKPCYNTVLDKGKEALARALAGDIGSAYDLYVCKMLFGTNGTIDGVARFVESTRNGLFGTTLLSKNVTTTIDPSNPTQVIFTTILTYNDAVGSELSEMALQLANGDLYSMVTFGNVSKTGTMQITYNWKILMV